MLFTYDDMHRKARVIPRHRKHQKVLSSYYRGFKVKVFKSLLPYKIIIPQLNLFLFQEGYLSIIFYPANFTLSAQQGKNQFLIIDIYFEYCGIHTTMKYENPFETYIIICAIAIVQFTLYTDPFRYKNYLIHFNVKCN